MEFIESRAVTECLINVNTILSKALGDTTERPEAKDIYQDAISPVLQTACQEIPLKLQEVISKIKGGIK